MDDSPAIHGLDPLQHPPGLVGSATGFDLLHLTHDLGRLDAHHGAVPQHGEDVGLQGLPDAALGVGAPPVGLVRQPGSGHRLEGIDGFMGLPGTVGITGGGGVDAQLDELTGRVGFVSGIFQPHLGIHAQRQPVFLSTVAVLQPPVAPARLGQFQVQAPTVKVFARGGEGAKFGVSQWHGGGYPSQSGGTFGGTFCTQRSESLIPCGFQGEV